MTAEASKRDLVDSLLANDEDVSSFSEATKPEGLSLRERMKRQSFLPVVGAVIFAIIYMIPIMPTYPIEHSCFAVLFLVSFFWVTESIPSFCAAYLVPLFGVWLGLGYDSATGARSESSALASTFSWRFMDPIIFVFLGSMTMSDCLSKLNITDRVSNLVFRHLSKNPRWVLLSLMMLNVLIASLLSNVASTTLILTFTMPIIRSLDPDDPFIKALLFGIAWSGNCGGMPTTIASPQNILAMKYIKESTTVEISFVKWMYFGLPLSLVLCILCWAYLMWKYTPLKKEINVGEARAEFEGWGVKHTYVSIITILTIVLWTINDTFPRWLGHVGITSLLPVICFFGSGVMTPKDFLGIRWSTLALMGGGLALGEAMKMSGLLDLIASSSGFLKGISAYPLLIIILFFLGIFASLINSTSAAAILYPVIGVISSTTGHDGLMVVLSAIMISGAQLFHISSFPNALVSGVCRHAKGKPENVTEQPFLSGKEYFIVGWPTLFSGVIVTASVGYGIAYALGL